MENYVFKCALIIVLATVVGITIYRIETMPTDKTCPNISKESAENYIYCSEYDTIEKIRYAWGLYK